MQSLLTPSLVSALPTLLHCLFSQNKNGGKKESQHFPHLHKLCTSSHSISEQNRSIKNQSRTCCNPREPKTMRFSSSTSCFTVFLYGPDSQQQNKLISNSAKGTLHVCGQNQCVRNPLFTIDGLTVIWVILWDFTLNSDYISYLISEKFFAN